MASPSPSGSKSSRSSSSRDELPPFKFGPYSPLNLPDESSRKGISNLVSKITDFNELKIYPEIRNSLLNEVKKHTVLRSQNFVRPAKVKTENELNGLIIRPTPIQTAAIKIINNKRKPGEFFKTFTLAAETGSGKTWAYLAPLLQQLLQGLKEPEVTSSPSIRAKAGIKSVILVPTHELVDQVYETAKYVGDDLNLSVFKWDTDSNFKEFISVFRTGIDIFVTTPGKFHSLSRYDSLKSSPKVLFGSISFCVVDEADTLMDESFLPDTQSIISKMSRLETLVFASATYPARFNKTINHLYPTITTISTPQLHKLPKSIEFRVVNASVAPYKGSKMKALAQALYAIYCDGTEEGYQKRVLIFVNKKDDCEKVSNKLQEYGHDVTFISSEDTPDARREKVAPFISTPTPSEERQLKVLVCTDLLSRGLNFKGVRNVILLDVPANSADLVHRAGRTGRMNQGGRVFLIINDADKGHVKGLPKVLRNNRRLG
ncbi:ATP-dependent RNA helicase MRH4, mitochondrial [Pichia kudriavzevii]|nr:ATP-dependent RNA helicase MRH4, mitochondrial [Pichia kudriavzevii]